MISTCEIGNVEDVEEDQSLLPKSQTWWLFLFWFLTNLLTWITAVLVPAKTFTQNIEVVVPPRRSTSHTFKLPIWDQWRSICPGSYFQQIADRICEIGLHWMAERETGTNSPPLLSTRYATEFLWKASIVVRPREQSRRDFYLLLGPDRKSVKLFNHAVWFIPNVTTYTTLLHFNDNWQDRFFWWLFHFQLS